MEHLSLFQNTVQYTLLTHQPKLRDGNSILQTISQLPRDVVVPKAERTCWVASPSNAEAPGFQTIDQFKAGDTVYAEGSVITESEQTLVIQSADCPIVIIRNHQTGAVLVFHAGRNALDGGQSAINENIISLAVPNFLNNTHPKHFSVYITPHICGGCFDHSYKEATHRIEWFQDTFGDDVFCDPRRGRLSLQSVIIRQLTELGILESEISYDQRCTMETESLSSHRRGDITRNSVIITRL